MNNRRSSKKKILPGYRKDLEVCDADSFSSPQVAEDSCAISRDRASRGAQGHDIAFGVQAQTGGRSPVPIACRTQVQTARLIHASYRSGSTSVVSSTSA